MPIHIAITRRVKPEYEAEFQQALREFFQASFNHKSVLGANLLIPPPGSSTREYGILRTFTSEAERDDFYASSLFQEWETRVKPMTEGEPTSRKLCGLEAWFRANQKPPPRWKMAIVTLIGVYPTSLAISFLQGANIFTSSFLSHSLIFSLGMVLSLTWIVMPLITRLFRPWLKS
ncbi:MAG: antibiotic biosynthesis monooxygenase [Verrucomicrobiia bacterium]